MDDGRDPKLVSELRRLAKAAGAIVLAHSYQLPEIQDAADLVGDSLELSRAAASTNASVIVFCGVRFMAETAKLLSPAKKVVLPVPDAGCYMADMISGGDVRSLKAENPGLSVVTYINSTAEVKAESYICCTSANAVRVVESLPGDSFIFVPDRNLGSWCAKRSGKRAVLWQGFCPVHVRFNVEEILAARAAYPDAVLLAHPECESEVVDLADAVLSTSQMIAYARESPATTFLIATEAEVMYRMSRENPGKRFLAPGSAKHCVNMKKTRIADLHRALLALSRGEDPVGTVELPGDLADRARLPIERMLKI